MSPRIRGSGGGGGGLTESAADAIYLRLDASNDPLTDQLSIQGGGVDIDHVQATTGDSEKYDVTMSSITNPGSARFFGYWDDQGTIVSNYHDTWAAKITGTRIGATGAELRVGVIAGITASDHWGHFLPRHSITDVGGTPARWDLGGQTTLESVEMQWRNLYLGGDIIINGVISSLVSNSAATSPLITDDSDSGYQIGARWLNTATQQDYVATAVPVGAAVWVETTGAGSGVTRAYVPAGITTDIPDRHQILVSGLYEVEATGQLDIDAGGKLVVLKEVA